MHKGTKMVYLNLHKPLNKSPYQKKNYKLNSLNKMPKSQKWKNCYKTSTKKRNSPHKKIKKPKKKKNNLIKHLYSLLKIKLKLMQYSRKPNPHLMPHKPHLIKQTLRHSTSLRDSKTPLLLFRAQEKSCSSSNLLEMKIQTEVGKQQSR